MAYQKINFLDQDVERPRTYEMQENQDGTVTLVDSFGVITEIGTPINRENMNHIEDGIVDVENNVIEVNNNLTNKIEKISEDLINKIGIPDYTQGIQKMVNTEYISNSDGWLYARVNSRGNPTRVTLTIDGVNLNLYSENYSTNDCLYPISKDTLYKYTLSGDNFGSYLYFYPAKGVN